MINAPARVIVSVISVIAGSVGSIISVAMIIRGSVVFTPSRAFSALLGVTLGIRDVKSLFSLGLGIDFALISLTAFAISVEIAPTSRYAAYYAAVAMPALHLTEWEPCFGYQFTLAMLPILLFIIRFFKTNHAGYLCTAALVLVAFTYGMPDYFTVVQAYIAVIFFLLCVVTHRREISAASIRRAARTLLSAPSLLLLLLTAGLAAVRLAIDLHAAATMMVVAPGREPGTLSMPLNAYLNYLGSPAFLKLFEIITGRPIPVDAAAYFGLSGLALVSFAVCCCPRHRFLGPLLGIFAVIMILAFPHVFPHGRLGL
jgi:hypothetical protein